MKKKNEIENTIKTITYNGLTYSINDKQKIANVSHCSSNSDEIIIPHSIEYESNEYIVTSILKRAFFKSKIKSIKFAFDSEIQTIEKNAFNLSSIESIMIPSSLIDLKDGWCSLVDYLNKIIVSPNNPRYSILEEKMIIGKSSIEQENYDVLIFCVRDIQTVIIPTFIEKIGPYAFDRCRSLRSVEFPNDSKVQTFSISSFSWTNLKEISIPAQVTLIDKRAFSCCNRLKRIKFPSNSMLQTVGSLAFNLSTIENFTIPSKLVNLEDEWCMNTKKLVKIDVSPNNTRYSILNDKMIIGKSSIEQDNYDVLVFCVRDIKTILIPSFIKHIRSYAFDKCNKLQTVEFKMNSQLITIDEYAFSSSSISCIVIPPNVSDIGEDAFFDCKNLLIIEMNDNDQINFILNSPFKRQLNLTIMIPVK